MVTTTGILTKCRRLIGNDHMILVFLAMIAGGLAGSAVTLFREIITLIQILLYGSGSERLFVNAETLAWWKILLVPVAGGLVVGAIVQFLLPQKRPQGVADVIEASALKGGWMSSRTGLVAALGSAISIGAGASVGREGPAVHLGASLAGWIGRRLHLSRSLTRTLLGCGVAAAVAASFNAPIAGALFASEVVIGHYALRAFAPIVIASVAGTAVSRAFLSRPSLKRRKRSTWARTSASGTSWTSISRSSSAAETPLLTPTTVRWPASISLWMRKASASIRRSAQPVSWAIIMPP